MGFAQALGNVDRHRIQSREDAQRYAIGVLGLGSLLLTQLRHEHGDLLHPRPADRGRWQNEQEGSSHRVRLCTPPGHFKSKHLLIPLLHQRHATRCR